MWDRADGWRCNKILESVYFYGVAFKIQMYFYTPTGVLGISVVHSYSRSAVNSLIVQLHFHKRNKGNTCNTTESGDVVTAGMLHQSDVSAFPFHSEGCLWSHQSSEDAAGEEAIPHGYWCWTFFLFFPRIHPLSCVCSHLSLQLASA